jgi:hypothetical protein
VTQVYRKKWVIHVERITREKVNGEHSRLSSLPPSAMTHQTCIPSAPQLVQRAAAVHFIMGPHTPQ